MQDAKALEVLVGAVVREIGRRFVLGYQTMGALVQLGGMVIDRLNRPRPRAAKPDLDDDDEELLLLQAADPQEYAQAVAARDARCWTLLLDRRGP